MTPAEQDIIAVLRPGKPRTVNAIAKSAGCSAKTVRRLIRRLESAGIVTIVNGGGRGRKLTVEILPKSTNFDTLSLFHRVYEDPADKRPGEEYTPVADIDAARADRARLMANTSWRTRPDWARRGGDANQ